VRGNGLKAARYEAVADLDPGTADAMLAALRDCGVAAYAAATPDPVPDGDTDRLYVDVAAVEQARLLITVQLSSAEQTEPAPGPGPDENPGRGPDAGAGPHELDMDAEFAAIVASFHSAPAGHRPWPAAEDMPAEHHRGTPEAAAEAADVPGPSAGPGAGDASVMGWEDLLRPLPVPEPEPDAGYVPPPPPPLPETSVGTRFAWAAVLGGPAVLFAAVLLGWHLADWMMLAAALAFLGGFVALVARLGDRPEDCDDDGAVI
jgi:hypothetical protein